MFVEYCIKRLNDCRDIFLIQNLANDHNVLRSSVKSREKDALNMEQLRNTYAVIHYPVKSLKAFESGTRKAMTHLDYSSSCAY